jgi:Fe-Mn family superoxide dismutase
MEIHHSKHHNGYTNNLNNALENVALTEQPIEEILRNLDMNNAALRNNAGGYYNHCLFWEILNPKDKQDLDGDLESAINSSFGSFENFKEGFSKAAATRFGSGWAWLCVKDGKLEICSSANQDNPIMPSIACGGKPIMGIDVWEHAYYLNYQNRRADYITAFFDVVNWRIVSEKFKNA